MITAETVAESLHQAVTSGVAPDAAVSGVVASLKHRGSLALLPRVLTAYERILRKAKAHQPHLMLATKTDTKAALADAAKKLGVAESDITVVTDDTLIGGYILRSKDQRIDASYKRSLLALYHRITHTD